MGGNSSRALNAVTTAITAALGGQTDLQVVTNTLAPYAAQVIGGQFGHGEDKNTAAQLVSHAILGATLAYINGGDPTAGGSAAVASEAAAIYLTNQYKDKKEYQDANGEFQPNLLTENVKAQIRDLTAGIGAVIGGAVGDSSYNAQLAGVIGQNAVENNRMLHREEVDLIQNLAKEYAKEKGISLEEAETQLTRGALYNIDEGWKDAFDSKLDASDIAEYNLAYQYLLAQTKDGSVDEINSNFYNYTNSKGTIVVIGRLNSSAGHISDSELQKADSYIGEAGKGFIATAEDFKNKDIFLTNTLAGNTNEGSEYYNDKKEFIHNSAAIKDSEISFFEGLSSSVDRDISEAKGAVIGVGTGAKDTVIGIYEFLKHPIDNTKELISAAADAVKNPAQTAKNVSEGIDQGLEKYNTTIDLYKMQKDEGAEAEYKANIAGQVLGAGGVGVAGKKGAEAVVDSVKKAQQVAKEAEIAEALKKKQSIENNASRDDFQQYDHYREDYAKDYRTGDALPDGSWNWNKEAPNGGAVLGSSIERKIAVGEFLDRFGPETGRYLANPDYLLDQRSLPPGTNVPNAYHKYEVLKPFHILEEEIAPAFGQPGGGKQIRAKIPEVSGYATVEDLKY